MKLGNIGPTSGMAPTARVDVGATARALAPLGQAAGMAAETVYAGRREDKAEADKEYQIGVQLANKYNQDNAKAQNDRAFAQTIGDLTDITADYEGKESFTPDELEGFGLDIPLTEMVPHKDGEKEVPRTRIPAYEVLPQLVKTRSEAVMKANAHRMTPEDAAEIQAAVNKSNVAVMAGAIKSQNKENKIQADQEVQTAQLKGQYEIAAELVMRMDISDSEKYAKLHENAKSDSNYKFEKALREDDYAYLSGVVRDYNNPNSGKSYGETPVFDGAMSEHEASNPSALNGKFAAYAKRSINVTGSTINEILDFQVEWLESQYSAGAAKRGEGSSALGKYQIVSGTLRQAMDELGLTGGELFDEGMQDYIAKEYLLKAKRPKLQKYMESVGVTSAMEDAALFGLGEEWEGIKKLPREEKLAILRGMRADAQANYKSKADAAGMDVEDWQAEGDENLNPLSPREQTTQYDRASAKLNAMQTAGKAKVSANISIDIKDSKILGSKSDSGEQTSAEQEQASLDKLAAAAAAGSKPAIAEYSERLRQEKRKVLMSFIANNSSADSELEINKLEADSDGSAESIDAINHARQAQKDAEKSFTTDMQAHMVKVGVTELEPISFINDSVEDLSRKLGARYKNKTAGEHQFNVKDANILEEKAAKQLLSDIENTANPAMRMELISKIAASTPNSTELFHQLSSRSGSKYAVMAGMISTDKADVAMLAMQGEQIANADYNKGKVIGGPANQLNIFFDTALNGALGNQVNTKNGRYKLMSDLYAKQASINGFPIGEFDQNTAEQVTRMAMNRVVDVGDKRIEVPNQSFSGVDFDFGISDMVTASTGGDVSYDSYLRDFLPSQLAELDALSFEKDASPEVSDRIRDGELTLNPTSINTMQILMPSGLPLMLKSGDPIELKIYDPDVTISLTRQVRAMPPEIAGVPSAMVPMGGKITTVKTAGSIYGPLDEAARGM